jgi:hypothetical protein
MSHLCRFGTVQPTDEKDAPRLKKRQMADSETDSSVDVDVSGIDGLSSLGGVTRYNLNDLVKDVWLSPMVGSKPEERAAELQRAVQTLPTRSITDALVQQFLGSINFNYNAIYPPTFLDEYTRWWSDRVAKRPLSPEYTCLLLRACSVAVQCLTAELRETIEFELSCEIGELPERFHQAAEALSSTFTPGEKGLTQVQQLFLTTSWFKSEGRFIDAWHAMAACVREAQELGLHRDDSELEISEYEREMRRRLFCIIFVWDWQMSKWLGRPLLVDPTSATFQLPKLLLETDPSDPERPNPFNHMKLQVQLIRQISPALRDADSDPSEEKVRELRRILDDWIATIPKPWRYHDADTSWDAANQYIPWQRCLLHGTCFMVELLPLKPYLTGYATAADPRMHAKFQDMGIDSCVNTLNACHQAYEVMQLMDPKHFYLNFIFFDITTVLCSALIHDSAGNIPSRAKALEAIDKGMRALRRIAPHSRAGKASYDFVRKLTEAIHVSQEEYAQYGFGNSKRARASPSVAGLSQGFDSRWNQSSSVSPASQTTGQGSTEGSSSQVLDDVRVPSLKEFENTDFGPLEEMWDWEALNLDMTAIPSGSLMFEAPGRMHLPMA